MLPRVVTASRASSWELAGSRQLSQQLQGKAEQRPAVATTTVPVPGQQAAQRLSEATTWVILMADRYPGGEWPFIKGKTNYV